MYRVRQQIACEETDRQGLTGKNITIAILDSGIANHPDFSGRLLAFRDFVNHKEYNYDDASHGTHVCGIAAGSGAASSGQYMGIAPQSNLIVGKVLDHRGDGNIEDMIAGIDWVIENKERYQIRILNISIGVGSLVNKNLEIDALQSVERAWKAGIVVVAAAGNTGPTPMSISPIGASKLVITVGCHDGDYVSRSGSRCENYSARGPSQYALKKPDIVAPGTEIISCNATVRRGRRGYHNVYAPKSGTSMATPIISGACALLLEKHPEYSNDEVKRKLSYSATDLHEVWTKQGWGMVNVKRLLED